MSGGPGPSGPIARAACPHCGRTIPISYVLLGSSVQCDSCADEVVPRIPVGGRYPETRHELTFADFERLVRDGAYRRDVGRLFRAWGYALDGEGEAATVRRADGEHVDLLALHLGIQNDPERQRALYQLAMSLWR